MATRKLRTSALLNRISQTSDIRDCLAKNEEQMRLPDFSAFITALCKQRGVAPQRIIERANIENSFGHQLFKGTRKASRDTVLLLAFGFEADVQLTQELLRHGRLAQLYPRVKRDAALIYCFSHGLNVIEAQALLQELELPLLGGSK